MSHDFEFDPRMVRKNVFGYSADQKSSVGAQAVTTIWNPYKHQIIMETHFMFNSRCDFYYFSDGVPYYTLYLFRGNKISSNVQVEQIGRTLLVLNPDIYYNYFVTLMKEIISPSYENTDHSKVGFTESNFSKMLSNVFNNRIEPRTKKKFFFFNPRVNWDTGEIQSIIKQIKSPVFDIDDEIVSTIRRIYSENGKVTHTDLAEEYKSSLSTISKYVKNNPRAKQLLKDLREQNKELHNLNKKSNSKVRKEVFNYWKSNHKLIPFYKLFPLVRSEKLSREIVLSLMEKYNRNITKSKKYKSYMSNVKGLKVIN